MLLGFEALCKAVSGTFICNYSSYPGFNSVTTDSRTVHPHALFIPLRGTHRDGHRYIEQALREGADCVFCDVVHLDAPENAQHILTLCKRYEAACIRVEHTLKALQDAAAAYLEQFPQLLKIGITGSNGKTTTKELLASIFTQKYRTVKNEGNLNSETGLPLSVFTVTKEHEVGIFELGMNRKGEIAELAAVLKPNIAVITNIGSAHIGILGSKDAIAQEKKQIFSLFDENSVGFIPAQDEYTAFLQEVAHGKIFTYDADPGSYTLEGLSGAEIRYKGETIRLPLPGKHNVHNAFAAIAVAEYCNIPPQSIKAGIENMQALFGRSQIIYGPVTYLLDCYNANPDSMNAGLAVCANITVSGKKIYVLASMKELGSESQAAHRAVCEAAFESDADALFFFGKEMCEAAVEQTRVSNNKPFFCFKETEAKKLRDTLDSLLKPNDFVFLKGSRSLELEQFEPILKKERV